MRLRAGLRVLRRTATEVQVGTDPRWAVRLPDLTPAEADLLLCVGSSLEVWPVAELPEVTLGSGGEIALVTIGPTPYDDRAAVKLSGDVVTELEAVVAAL